MGISRPYTCQGDLICPLPLASLLVLGWSLRLQSNTFPRFSLVFQWHGCFKCEAELVDWLYFLKPQGSVLHRLKAYLDPDDQLFKA